MLDATLSHRIISESGTIEISGTRDVVEAVPTYAHTLCGTIHSNISREVLDQFNFQTGQPRRDWLGFVTPSKGRFSSAKFERPARALQNKKRASGVDVISKAGTIRIFAAE